MFTTLTSILRTMRQKILKQCQPVSIVGYTVLPEERLYDIEVAIDHCYTLTDSGIVTKNSNSADAFRYLALVAGKSVAMPTENAPAKTLPQTASLGQDIPTRTGYSLDKLWKDREQNKRLRPLRI